MLQTSLVFVSWSNTKCLSDFGGCPWGNLGVILTTDREGKYGDIFFCMWKYLCKKTETLRSLYVSFCSDIFTKFVNCLCSLFILGKHWHPFNGLWCVVNELPEYSVWKCDLLKKESDSWILVARTKNNLLTLTALWKWSSLSYKIHVFKARYSKRKILKLCNQPTSLYSSEHLLFGDRHVHPSSSWDDIESNFERRHTYFSGWHPQPYWWS